jgi:predicted  nucleic acid-binding Zn-ribbon protein
MLNEELKKTKKDRDALEKEVQSLNLKLREAEQEFEKKISEVTAEIEIMSSQNAVEME